MSDLALKNITKKYPSGVVAVKDFTLEVEDKAFIAICGLEKSGKSTVLRMISGLETITDGELYINGKYSNDLSAKERDVAYIFQGSPLNAGISVYDNIAYGLKIRNIPDEVIKDKISAVAEIFGLTDILNKKIKNLTSLQKQRIIIARAIVREPKIYLLDEPLAGLAVSLQSELKQELIKLQARLQSTFIYATENATEAMSVANKIVVMNNGEIEQIDSPLNLYKYPATEYVASLFGSPLINLYDGKIVKEENQFLIETVGKKFALTEEISSKIENIEEYATEGKAVRVGIRPEFVMEKDSVGENSFNAVIESVEGKVVSAKINESKNSYITYLSQDAVIAKEVNLTIEVDKILLFDKKTKKSIINN